MSLLSVWTDGLHSNLVAEFVGLVSSIIATYLIVDKVIKFNQRRHYRPLRQALLRAVGQNMAALGHLWAFEFGLAGAKDLEETLSKDLTELVNGFCGLIEERISAMETSSVAREDFLNARSAAEVLAIARETFEDIAAIGDVANRVSQVVLDDIDLETIIADLESEARTLDHVRSFSDYLSNVKMSTDLPLDLLLVLSLKLYRGAMEAWVYLQEQVEKESR